MNAIRPGKVWLDTEGKRIQAHGGSMFYENGTFYWYGENKEKTNGGKIWHWGVKCYSSKDLYNWKDEGLIIEPNLKDKNSPLHPHRYLDRPHILYNEKTRKYVCFLKFSGMDASNHFLTVLTADKLLGPYSIVKERLNPLGKDVGDFDVFEKDGKAYIYFESEHERLICAQFTDDFLDLIPEFTEHFADLLPPFTREAPAHFERNGKHYLITSGMLGYIPNPSETSVAEKWNGPFSIQGNAHPNDVSCSSYNSQISCVFKHPHKKDLYIAMADRWVPKFPMTEKRYEALTRITQWANKQKVKVKIGDFILAARTPFMKAKTSIADYVWLPVRFDGDRAYIEWRDEWNIEEFD